MQHDSQHEDLAELLRTAAGHFSYPATPDIAGAVGRRAAARSAPRWPLAARVALALALLLAALLAVPEVRAAALRLLQVGVVRVRVEPAAPTVLPAPTALPPPTAAGAAAAPRLPDLAGALPPSEAVRRVRFPVLLPSYPADLGAPAAAFLQDLDGEALVLVWADPADPRRVRLSLHMLSSRMLVDKMVGADETVQLAETEVGGERALWLSGPHLLRVGRANRGFEPVRLVEGNTLIWTAGGITYRLESELPLDEARRVAESLRPAAP